MTRVLQSLVDGLGVGSTYALLALGISLIFGVMHLVNFAHGELITVGAYTAYFFFLHGGSWWWMPVVIVASAGNAVENLVGVRAAAASKMDLATSLILNSSLQVAIALTPALVLISLFLGGGALTLVLSPLLLGAVVLAAILAAVIVFDGESTWLEGLALLGLYIIIAASVLYGPPIRI